MSAGSGRLSNNLFAKFHKGEKRILFCVFVSFLVMCILFPQTAHADNDKIAALMDAASDWK